MSVFNRLRALFSRKADFAAAPAPSRAPNCPPSNPEDYRNVLMEILGNHSDQAKMKITGALDNLPIKTKCLQFGIHPSQDEGGTFSVMIHLDGPDLYVLNKAIAEYRKLFNVRHTATGLDVPVPLYDPDDAPFQVNDVVADTAADWIAGLWADAGQGHPDLPVFMFCHDDWGKDSARWLQGGPARC